jgi:GT2 family glycosyltransferase
MLSVSIMITTRNRLADLKRTVGVLKQLDPAPEEILITADGCTDGTAGFIRAEWPEARLFVNEAGRGSVASRKQMMLEAAGDLVLALDDDSYPEQNDCLQRLKELFANRPNVAVAHFPQHTDEYPESLKRTDFGEACATRSFANSGACLRRSVYLRLPGFEPRFFHMYEEPDYGLQCVASGYEVLYTPIITIRHHWSGQSRSGIRNHHRHARNELWSTLIRCPPPYSLGLVGYRIFSQLRFALRQGLGWVIREPVWWWQALLGIPYCLRKAKPFPWPAYKRWLELPTKM